MVTLPSTLITLKHMNRLRQFSTSLYVVFLALAFASCGGKDKKPTTKTAVAQSTNIPIDDTLRQQLDKFANKPRVKGRFGLCVYDLTAQKMVYAMNEKEPIPSASCLKLLTGVAAYHLLGTRYCYSTSLFTRGKVSDGHLQGDVTFRADYDPQLNAPDLKLFAQALRRKGIRQIDGRLILDLCMLYPVQAEPHWYPWDLTRSKYGLLYQGLPRIRTTLKQTLRAQGISVADSQLVAARVPRGSHCIFRYKRPIDLVVRRMWKNSSNTQATSMLFTIGHQVSPKDSASVAGVAYLRKFLRNNLGQTDKRLVIHDGCGLCTQNRLSAASLVAILRYGCQDKAIFNKLWRLLSISGVDGTLRRSLSQPALKGRIHAKTGTLSHPYGISSLAGYAKAANGHLLAFAIMDSEMSVLDAHVLQRQLCQVLVTSY